MSNETTVTQIKNIVEPIATESCGIHINISSAPSLLSPNLIEIINILIK